ncbi:hypothetical protein B0T26DRAFT_632578, partial [Lasiosphaeria miniovina]
GHPGGDSGEGDSTGGLRPERIGVSNWAILVIESGYSEILLELYKDMQWWFQVLNHEVKIVILAKFDDQKKSRLHKERSRGQNGVLSLVKRQSIIITRNKTTNPVSYNITRGALVLGFRLLFLRDLGPQEGDFVLAFRACSCMQRKSRLSCRDQTSQPEISRGR